MRALPLELSHVCAGYGPVRILDTINLRLHAGGRLAVLGRNGMGKTTLLATIAGQTNQESGTILLDGKNIGRLNGPARALAGLGYVPQHRAIFKALTVEENLLAGLKARPPAALEEAYAMFPRLHQRRRHLGGQLSGGEQQMLSVARTLLGQPGLLLLDEPLEGLAPIICDELIAAFSQLAASGSTTIILVEQRLAPALQFADAVLILERGQVAWSGTPAELNAQPNTIYRLLGIGT